jgi:hypothetical protein
MTWDKRLDAAVDDVEFSVDIVVVRRKEQFGK